MLTYATVENLEDWALDLMASRPCDLPIGGEENPYLKRWYVLPRNELQNVYLHQILRDDDDRALHDHPWTNTSVIISGGYIEHVPDGYLMRKAGDVITRVAESAHRLELINGEPCVSLFFAGPKTRDWGFHCPQGWVRWQDFTGGENGELIGRGCGE